MNWKEDPRGAYVFVNLSCLMWASDFIARRTLREEVGPLMLTVVSIGIFPWGFACLSWNEGVRRVGPNRAMVFSSPSGRN